MRKLTLTLLLGSLLGATVAAQGSLSAQVLQLLTRINTWTATNTFYDLRLATGIPTVTTSRLYTDGATLYWNGAAVAGSGSVTAPHNLLSTTHPDTLAGSPARGSVLVGNSTPVWSALTVCAAGAFLGSDGTDTGCRTNGSALTNLTSANLTGTLPAISGVNLTSLNASNLGSGTVPLARLSGITTTEISASAAIAYSKLNLTGLINLSTDTAATALPFAKGGTGLTSASDDTIPVSSGSAWVAAAVPDCVSNTTALAYTAASNTFSCQTLAVGSGSVTSVALALPAIFTVSGSPVTTTGTLTGTLATQAANLVWAGPTTGAAAAPTFRALVNADFPASGVVAGTYNSLTVNTQGIATAGSTIDYSTSGTGTLPRNKGGTGSSTSADDTVLIGNGTSWVATSVPNCPASILQYTAATNVISCTTAVGGLTASTAGAGTIGSTSLPFLSLILGTAATTTLTVTPAAFATGSVATVNDPGITTTVLPLVKRGTVAYTSGALSAGTCATAVTTTVTGLATTSTVAASLNAAPQTAWKTGITFYAYPTANTVNILVCNPTAGSITPESATFNFTAVVP